jgi:hypothetical protein
MKITVAVLGSILTTFLLGYSDIPEWVLMGYMLLLVIPVIID